MENRFIPATTARGADASRFGRAAGLSRQQSGLARALSVGDRVLVVLIENGGIDLELGPTARKIVALLPGGSHIPDSVIDKLADQLRGWIKSRTDNLLENAELALGRYRAAKGSSYGDVIILRDGTASYDELKRALIDQTRAGKVIDLLILTHGSNDFISVQGSIDSRKIRDIKAANGGPLSIRTVYMMNCVGASLNQAWIDAGARASAGTIRNNDLPEPTTFFFWNAWKEGASFETAVLSAYRKTVNLLNDAIKGLVLAVAPLAALVHDFSITDADFIRGSAPIVLGARAVTINSDDLSQAKSLSSSLATTVLPIGLLQALSEGSATAAPARPVSASGLAMIKASRTFRAKLYKDANGHCSIGYGTHLHRGDCDGRPVEEPYMAGISEEQASELLLRRLAAAQERINAAVRVPLTQNQSDALTSFVFGVGPTAFDQSTLLRLLNAGNFGAVPVEMRKWTRERRNGTAVERPQLVKRREAEAALFAGTAPGAAASTLSAIDYAITGAFEVITQPSPRTCWAAVFTMMYCWRNTRSTDIPSALATLGGPYLEQYRHDKALDAGDAQRLYDAAGLVTLNGFNPTIDGWLSMLKKYGPLYVDVGFKTGTMTHAIIVTGITGDGATGGTSMVYVDPASGSTVTMKFTDFLAKFEAQSALTWPYTIVHWPPATGADATMSITGSSVYSAPARALPFDVFSRQKNPAAIVAGIAVEDAAQIGLATAAIVQAQVAATQGSFTLTLDKAERLLTTEARQAMPGAAKGGKAKYQRLVLHIPSAHLPDAHADIIVSWEGNAYGEIGTVMITRDLANWSEWTRSKANIVMTWLHQIPSDGVDPRAWPIVYNYTGTYDPLGNGYFEFEGEFEITAFGAITFNKHKVYSRSAGDWVLKHDTDWYVQRGPDVPAPFPTIPKDQLDFLNLTSSRFSPPAKM